MTHNEATAYQSAVLKLYVELPETPAKASPRDRRRAAELCARGIELATVESAMLLASLRRLGRPAEMPVLSPIHSLAYFFPVIQELVDNPMPEDYRDYLQKKLRSLASKGKIKKSPVGACPEKYVSS